MQKFEIIKAEEQDLPGILEIYAYARGFMKKTGNAFQWKDSYPPEELVAEDIRAGQLYVIKEKAVIHGVFTFFIGEDPTYARIEQGRWLSDEVYGTIHRVAGDGTVHGILGAAVTFAEQQIRHLRIDTHKDNKVMQHLIKKNGFRECGIIYTGDGSPRIAYEKL
ncbi:acetyltransferase [Marvinbryantia formatexigens]|nr:acetyltransferase [Marvinbryantia formatexigens]UWO24830.1 N-acetyltransferase [Marvinbryantia formatexigens DSM 14469]SDG79761.1 hypothetical protein SAMN05660368_03307 [Marvinbryantia formatexigens]